MTEMTDKEREVEAKRIEGRKAEIARMSDAYLDELMRVTRTELTMLGREAVRRRKRRTTSLVELPCTLQDLETAIHSYGDHRGFRGKVVAVPAVDADGGKECIGVEEQE